jgi:hypothetical protein
MSFVATRTNFVASRSVPYRQAPYIGVPLIELPLMHEALKCKTYEIILAVAAVP